MNENVIILGAGASADSGAPLMNNFLDKAEDILSGNLERETKEHFVRLFDLLDEMQKVHSKAKIDFNNIETVFGAIEMAHIIKRLGNKTYEEIQEYKESIVRVIIETIENSMNFSYEGLAIYAPDSYQNFAATIKDRLENSSTSILTFNYDLGIDTALSRVGYNVAYGFEKKQPSAEKDFNLYKLHGSINWALSDDEQDIYPYYPDWFLRDLHPQIGYNSKGVAKLPVSKYFSHIANHMPDKVAINKSKSVIVPPSWNKNSYHGSISKVWQLASEKLSKAKNILIVGYSLPESDSFFRYLFALGTLGATRIRNIVVVNPELKNGDVDNRFKSMIGESIQPRYKYIQSKFDSAPSIIDEFLR